MKNFFDYFDYFGEYDEDREDFHREQDFEEHEEEEKPHDFIESDKDPVRIYLKEMSLVPLLTRAGETEIAQKMENGSEKMYKIIFSLPFVLEKLIEVGRLVRDGKAPLAEIVQMDDETQEDIAKERVHFYETTVRIESLNRKREVYLKRLGEKLPVPEAEKKKAVATAGVQRKPPSLLKLLEGNRNSILEKVRSLKLKEDVITVFSEELRKAVAEIEMLQKSISVVSKKSPSLKKRRRSSASKDSSPIRRWPWV
jgi:RNA polymerase primary sigma factor